MQANARATRGNRGRPFNRSAAASATGLKTLDEIFRAFADPTRIRILNILTAGELCVCDVVELLSLPQPLVSRHLAYLRHAGLVDVARESKYAHYRLAQPRNAVHRRLIACVRSCFSDVAALDDERRHANARVQQREESPCD